MTEEGCSHFAVYVREYSRDSFSIVNAYFSACISKEARRRKVNTEFRSIVLDLIIFKSQNFVLPGDILNFINPIDPDTIYLHYLFHEFSILILISHLYGIQ